MAKKNKRPKERSFLVVMRVQAIPRWTRKKILKALHERTEKFLEKEEWAFTEISADEVVTF